MTGAAGAGACTSGPVFTGCHPVEVEEMQICGYDAQGIICVPAPFGGCGGGGGVPGAGGSGGGSSIAAFVWGGALVIDGGLFGPGSGGVGGAGGAGSAGGAGGGAQAATSVEYPTALCAFDASSGECTLVEPGTVSASAGAAGEPGGAGGAGGGGAGGDSYAYYLGGGASASVSGAPVFGSTVAGGAGGAPDGHAGYSGTFNTQD
jgi:hypothetical protein